MNKAFYELTPIVRCSQAREASLQGSSSYFSLSLDPLYFPSIKLLLMEHQGVWVHSGIYFQWMLVSPCGRGAPHVVFVPPGISPFKLDLPREKH
jgi:hypothetical protein